MKRTLALAPLLWLCVALAAGGEETRVLDTEDGGQIRYTLRTHAPDAHLLDPALELAPVDALQAAKLVTRHLAAGRVEEVSLLSNAPKARFERLRESFAGWSAEDFARAFGRYFAPGNRIAGEAAIGDHRLLMWYLSDTDHLTGYFFVDVDGKLLLDDVPSETRTRLRRVLEAHRSGRAQ
ncbi:MAG: hypothetical protein EPN19_08770 [Betaproteobacteria bacterium]|nr:MAG: hypothetical protein EPN19_08770 [Betaproteobacteria bacterium]